jgi:transitional endoplasmic reticulum ATPase
MPLGPDVDLQEIAEHSHGFVGADLEALCQEIGMIALRRYLSSIRTTPDVPIDEADAGSLHVTREDCLAGLKEVEPSATREFFIEKSLTTFASIGGLERGEAAARRRRRACAHARRGVRAGRADAAARHPARRPVRHRQDRHRAGAVG